MSITPTLHWTFHHRLLCLFSAAFPIWFCGALHRNIGIKRLSRCTIQGRRIPISFIPPPIIGGSFIRANTSLSWLNSEKLFFRLTKSPLVSAAFFSQHLLYGIWHQGLRFHELQGTTAVFPSLLIDKLPPQNRTVEQNFGHKKPRKPYASGVFVYFEVSIISWRTAAHGELPSSRTSFSPSYENLL